MSKQTTTKMKKLLILAILMNIMFIPVSFAQNDPLLESTIKSVLKSFKNQDNQLLQQYIHPKYGVIYWNKIGVPINQSIFQKSEFKFPDQHSLESTRWFYEAPNAQEKLIKTNQLPEMDCQNWNKSGLYYKTLTTKPFSDLTKFNQSIIEQTDKQITHELKQLKPFEKQIVELQYVGKSRSIGDDLHLYFSKIDKQWYLSAFDNAGNCDA